MTIETARRLRLIPVLLAFASCSTTALANSFFGALSNFDAVNDTGQNCYGFEIEVDGILPADISYTFGSPYNRYGNPTKTATGTGTLLRYEATYTAGSWSTYTPFAPPGTITTGGHQFWTGGDANYPLKNGGVPGDHFGLAYNGNPTSVSYHWLFDNGSGQLITAPTSVKIPVPSWYVTPPVANPLAPAAVQAVVPALPKPPASLFGEAIWVKCFVTESSAPAQLDHLLVGDGAPGRDAAGNEVTTEVEVEWQLLQVGLFDTLDSLAVDMAPGGESVTRRYEFYKYTGSFDSDGQALDENPLDPLTPNIVGDFIGGQNAALNLAAFGIPEPGTIALLGIGLAGLLRRRRTVRG